MQTTAISFVHWRDLRIRLLTIAELFGSEVGHLSGLEVESAALQAPPLSLKICFEFTVQACRRNVERNNRHIIQNSALDLVEKIILS